MPALLNGLPLTLNVAPLIRIELFEIIVEIIKRERKSVEQAGIHFKVHTGDRLTPEMCLKVYDFYSDTCDQVWLVGQ